MKTILIIEDDTVLRETTAEILELENYKVVTAANGKRGAELAKIIIPDIIVCDIMMPELDGIETCRALRELPQFEHTIIAFLTARTEDYSQIAGFETGADDYMSKPLNRYVLEKTLKKWDPFASQKKKVVVE